LLLLRHGWGSLTVSQKGAKMNDDSEDIPMAYLLYVVLGILLVAAGTLLFIIECSSRLLLTMQSNKTNLKETF
jgi:hypothetical protein